MLSLFLLQLYEDEKSNTERLKKELEQVKKELIESKAELDRLIKRNEANRLADTNDKRVNIIKFIGNFKDHNFEDQRLFTSFEYLVCCQVKFHTFQISSFRLFSSKNLCFSKYYYFFLI